MPTTAMARYRSIAASIGEVSRQCPCARVQDLATGRGRGPARSLLRVLPLLDAVLPHLVVHGAQRKTEAGCSRVAVALGVLQGLKDHARLVALELCLEVRVLAELDVVCGGFAAIARRAVFECSNRLGEVVDGDRRLVVSSAPGLDFLVFD